MKRFSKFIQESVDLEEQKMTFQNAEKLKSKHLAAMQHHKKSGNSKGYAAHSMVVDKFEDAYDRHGTGVIPSGRIVSASQKAFKDHPHSEMKESVELEEKLKASDDMGDWVKDFQDSDAPQFKGKSQKKRQQMAIAAKLDAEREAGMRKEAVEVSHDRYMRSHGKKASGGEGSWMFTHKRMGDANVNDPKEVHSARGKFSDAKKSAQQWAKKHGHSTVYVMEEVELDEVSTEKLRDYAAAALQDKNKAKADKRWKYAGKAMQTVADREVKAAHARKYNKMEEVEQLNELSPKTLKSYSDKANKSLDRLEKQRDTVGKNMSKTTAAIGKRSATEKSAHAATTQAQHNKATAAYRAADKGAKKSLAGHSDLVKQHSQLTKKINKRMDGIDRAYDKMHEAVELDEVSDKKLDAYRQKAFADQPAGDDGSDKYRKRKFGRDLAFAKQTGRAKVLATKEEIDEKLASNIIRGDTYIGVPDRIVAQAKDKVNKMRPSTASEHSKAMQKALSDMGWELTISGKYVREETGLDEVYQETANYLVSEGIELESLNEEQLDELIGAIARGIGRGLKRTVINKKGNFRFSTAGRADAVKRKADATKRKSDNIERLRKQRERLQKERERLQRIRQARNT